MSRHGCAKFTSRKVSRPRSDISQTAQTFSRIALKALVGQEIGCSGWAEISQTRIDAFADVTQDWQGILTNSNVGRAAGFGGTVAHGFLTVSMLSCMAYSALPQIQGQLASINYGLDRLRFPAPVIAGALLRARFVLRGSEDKPDGALLMLTGVTVEAEGATRPVLVADWRILYTF